MDGQQGSLRNEDLPAMFWDALPENAEEHPDMAAIQALLAESTPEELAENFRVWVAHLGSPNNRCVACNYLSN